MNYEVRIKEILESSIRMAGQREKISCSFFEEYRKKNGFAKIVESDRSIYIRMYGEEPSKIGLQKIRFWRLGHHLPKNRAEALALGQALELEWDDLDTFLKEHCLMRGIEVRKNHAEMFEELFPEYLCQITDERLQQLNITPGMQEQQKCHIFYSDALDCIRMEEKSRRLCYWQHMYSRGFSGEFRKYFIKESVLSRETVMRVLILLMMPDLNVDILNGHLLELGYGELNEKRRQEGYV
ncbi:MAG: hypothetical protein EOM18_17360 [Clostridia bacterium]|nr:hypothetical protein [Clostridia bacterium]